MSLGLSRLARTTGLARTEGLTRVVCSSVATIIVLVRASSIGV